MGKRLGVAVLVLSVIFAADPHVDSPKMEAADASTVRFAVIGDYGDSGSAEAAVAALVKSWAPDFVITTGDNNYPNRAADTIDGNIGQYYQEFIGGYAGAYGTGAGSNGFFPSLGNYDWRTRVGNPAVPQPYLDYFTLPGIPGNSSGNERYYDFVRGPVHFFAIDSGPVKFFASREPDGIAAASDQAEWLRTQLALSEAPWRLVYMHHPPFSSGAHGPTPALQWPYGQWGATAVLAGHDHTYERIEQDGILYFVNGLGGRSKYEFRTAVDGSERRYNSDYGAMLVEASETSITFEFYSAADGGTLIDRAVLLRASPSPGAPDTGNAGLLAAEQGSSPVVSGAIPSEGALGLLLAVTDGTPAALADILRDAGCTNMIWSPRSPAASLGSSSVRRRA